MKNHASEKLILSSRKNLPTFRSINSIDILVHYAAEEGIDVGKLLAGSGIERHDLDNPDLYISLKQEFDVLRKVAELSPIPDLGLKLGERYRMTAQGVLGNAALCCETLLDAVRLMLSYIDLTLSYFSYEMRVEEPFAYVTLNELLDLKEIRRFICEREFVSVFREISDAIGETLVLNELRLAYPRPDYAHRYQEIFRCPIIFNAKEHMAIFNSSYLSKRLPMANRLSKIKYEWEAIDLFTRMEKSVTPSERVRQLILLQKEGIPSFQQITNWMNVSSRTLHRRLSAEGTSYKEILAEVRKTKAIAMLTETKTPVEKIAEDLGYSDVTNFYIAFKRWTGRTPISYRKAKP